MPAVDTQPTGAEPTPTDAPWLRVRGLPWPRWRASAWLLIGWCLLAGLWWLSRSVGLRLCPVGADNCAREAEISGFGGRYALGLATVAVALFALWWWDRRRASRSTTSGETSGDVGVDGEADAEGAALDLVRPTRSPIRLALASFAGTLAIALTLMTAPMAEAPFCATPIHVNSSMAYVLNCDSEIFMQLAEDPGGLLTPNNQRQSRPVYIYGSAVLTTVLGPVGDALHIGKTFRQTNRAWFPLVLLNLVVAASAAALLTWLVRRLGGSAWIAAILSVLLLANGLSKAFIWTPHQQMFGFLVPIAAVVIARWVWLRRPSAGRLALLGLGLGLGSLTYGSFILPVAVVGLILLVTRGIRRAIVPGLTFAVAFAIPNLAWIQFCKARSGTYYNNELELYDQFVWIPKAAKRGAGPLFDYAESMAVTTVRNSIHIGLYAIIAIVALSAVAVVLRSRLRPATEEQRAIVVSSIVTVAVSVAFVFGIGLTVDRIAFHVIPALLVLAGWLATRVAATRPSAPYLAYAVLILIAAAALHRALTTAGPYS